MAVTIGEIAKMTGVSPSAVSLSLNDRPGVSEETRIRVKRTAERLGYQKHKRVVTGLSQNVRYVIFCENGQAVKGTDFHAIVLQGIEWSAKELGFNVLISYFDAAGDWNEQLSSILNDVSGIILLATEVEEEHIRAFIDSNLFDRRVPWVLVDNFTSTNAVDSVSADNFGGAYQAVSYLLKKGHPDVGYLRSDMRIDSFTERERGFHQARKDFGLTRSAKPETIPVGISSEDAYRAMDQWLSEGGKPLSALFADNDIIAASCIRAMKAHGYRVPEDVSIIGFDDMPLCSVVDPTLTTVRIMKEQMGIMAMELLHSRMPEVEERRFTNFEKGFYRVTVSTKLIERSSVVSYNGIKGSDD